LLTMPTGQKPFTWESLNYEVPVLGGKLRLLNDVYGYVKPGKLTAIMGASGAGKTTLLDVLANRKNIGIITGDILIDGHPMVEISNAVPRTPSTRTNTSIHKRFEMPSDSPLTFVNRLPFQKRRRRLTWRKPFSCSKWRILPMLSMIGFPGYGLSVEAR